VLDRIRGPLAVGLARATAGGARVAIVAAPPARAAAALADVRRPPPVIATAAGELPVRAVVFAVATPPSRRQAALVAWRATGAGPVPASASRAGSSPAARSGQGAGRVVDWHPSLARYGASELNERFHRRFGTAMDEEAWHAWVAVKAATEAALRAQENLAVGLGKLVFDGHLGAPLRFDERGALVHPLFLVRDDGTQVGRLVGPLAATTPTTSVRLRSDGRQP
jgi:hypothetical protein